MVLPYQAMAAMSDRDTVAGVMVSGEPVYEDQVPRRERYEGDHPDVTITFERGLWHAVVPGRAEPLVRYELRALLDILEALDESA